MQSPAGPKGSLADKQSITLTRTMLSSIQLGPLTTSSGTNPRLSRPEAGPDGIKWIASVTPTQIQEAPSLQPTLTSCSGKNADQTAFSRSARFALPCALGNSSSKADESSSPGRPSEAAASCKNFSATQQAL